MITKEECKRLLEGDAGVLKENGNQLLLELYAKMCFQQLRPKNIVDYMREAYVFPAGNVRITLDYDIRSGSDVGTFLETEINTVSIPKVFILEVKYDKFLPELMRGVVSLSSRQSAAFSKYAAARII